MIETQAPVAAVRAAHRQFVTTVSDLTADQLAAPTALPGWTRGHVIAHVADGGHAFATITELALRGELTALFPGGVTERNERIEKLAASPSADLMAHLDSGIARLEAAWDAAGPADWSRPVRFRNGDLTGTVFARWREVWIHLVDCAVGVTPAGWPEDLSAHSIDFLRSRLPAGVALVATDTAQRWGPSANAQVTDAATPETTTLSGAVRDIAAWLAGREPTRPLAGPRVELGEWPPHPTPNR
jgi:maleylpyruvate isomerase